MSSTIISDIIEELPIRLDRPDNTIWTESAIIETSKNVFQKIHMQFIAKFTPDMHR